MTEWAKAWTRPEAILPALGMLVAVLGYGFTLQNKVDNLDSRIGRLERTYENIDNKLDSLITEVREDRVAANTRPDPWTGAMQVEFQNIWVDVMEELHPEAITRTRVPNIRIIQKNHPVN